MKKWLYNIRTPKHNPALWKKIVYSILILLLGIVLGIFSKWLDLLSIDDTVWWQHFLGVLDLRNVFSSLEIWLVIALAISVYSSTPWRAGCNVFLFFTGMCISYHWFTMEFAGFNPRSYMLIWYGITLCSPLFALVCWFGKGKAKISLAIDIFILTVMMICCFSMGIWYFSFISKTKTLIFIASAAVLYCTPRRTAVSLLGAVILSYCVRFSI